MLIRPTALILKQKYFWNLFVVAMLERFISIKTKEYIIQSTKMSIPGENQHANLFGWLGIGEPKHLRMRWRNVWTREKNAVPPDIALERRTKRVIPGFRPVRSLLDAVGPSLLFATDLASRYGIEGEICRPLNHMWQIPRLLTAPDRPCQFTLRIRSLKYTREKSSYACINFISSRISESLQELLSSRHYIYR